MSEDVSSQTNPDDVEALLALERRVRDGVGLPTP